MIMTMLLISEQRSSPPLHQTLYFRKWSGFVIPSSLTSESDAILKRMISTPLRRSTSSEWTFRVNFYDKRFRPEFTCKLLRTDITLLASSISGALATAVTREEPPRSSSAHAKCVARPDCVQMRHVPPSWWLVRSRICSCAWQPFVTRRCQ